MFEVLFTFLTSLTSRFDIDSFELPCSLWVQGLVMLIEYTFILVKRDPWCPKEGDSIFV